jgi:P-type Ca2+ transporter type 2C
VGQTLQRVLLLLAHPAHDTSPSPLCLSPSCSPLLLSLVAKDASDIVILDDNFASIVKAVLWGRSVFDNIRKFLQFQLTVNLVALTVTFLSAVTGHAPPLNAVMMLWVNLIMDTMGALALGTESPSQSLLKRLPYRRNASLISRVMWRNILCQSIFQIVLLGYLLKLGPQLFNSSLASPFSSLSSDAVVHDSLEHYTIIFNVFVFCQIFNEYNARSIGSDPNVFSGLHKNPIFLMISAVTVAGQYLLVQHGGDFVKTMPLSPDIWFKCILLASLTLPVGGLMRLLPIPERKDDLITPNKLMSHHTRHLEGDTGAGQTKGSSKYVSQSSGISLIFWLTIVTIIPAAIVKTFQFQWPA